MTLFIITVLLIASALLICAAEIFLIYRQSRLSDQTLRQHPILLAMLKDRSSQNIHPYFF
jgi:signal transduction histidine kinase